MNIGSLVWPSSLPSCPHLTLTVTPQELTHTGTGGLTATTTKPFSKSPSGNLAAPAPAPAPATSGVILMVGGYGEEILRNARRKTTSGDTTGAASPSSSGKHRELHATPTAPTAQAQQQQPVAAQPSARIDLASSVSMEPQSIGSSPATSPRYLLMRVLFVCVM